MLPQQSNGEEPPLINEPQPRRSTIGCLLVLSMRYPKSDYVLLELVKLPEWKKVLGPQLKDRGPRKTCEIQDQISYQKISTEERNRIRGNFFIDSEDDLNSSHT